MSGSAIILPGAVTSSPFGKFHSYEATWDSTVYLWDAGVAALAAVPADAAVLPNLLRDRAAAVSGLTASVCDIGVNNQLNNGSAILASGEITSKKGIHIVSPQAGGQVAASFLSLNISSQFANWLLSQTDAGADYAVLATLWLRCTRAHVAGSGAPQSLAHIVNTTGTTANRLYYMAYNVPNSGVALGANLAPPTVGNAGLAAVSSQGWGGTKPTDLNFSNARRLAAIGASDAWSGFNLNNSPSYILYRAQLDLVDLSDIAGADRLAKCTAMIAEMNAVATRDFAVGGRFYGDTFTPAATLKP